MVSSKIAAMPVGAALAWLGSMAVLCQAAGDICLLQGAGSLTRTLGRDADRLRHKSDADDDSGFPFPASKQKALGACFDAETARLRRQSTERGMFDMVGGALSAVGAVKQPMDSIISGVSQSASGALEIMHGLENARADNCAQKAAVMTLRAVEYVSDQVGEVSEQVGDFREDVDEKFKGLNERLGAMNETIRSDITAVSDKVDETFVHITRTQYQLRSMEGRLERRALQATRASSLLALKLDHLLKEVLLNREEVRRTTYDQLVSSLMHAIAKVSGASSDLRLLVQQWSSQTAELTKLGGIDVRVWLSL